MERSNLLYKGRRKVQILVHRVFSDEILCKFYSWIILKKSVNLKNPVTFNEKIQWMKIHSYPYDDRIVQCADKYRVRRYIEKKGYAELLVSLIADWNYPDEIDWSKIPDQFKSILNHLII